MSESGEPQSTEQRLAAARSWAEDLNGPEAGPDRGAAPPTAAPAPESAQPAPETAQMSDRLQTVMGAVERAAEAIRADAEEQARRHLAEAQEKADRMTAERVRMISDLTDDLIEHASIVRDHSEQMVAALERAINGVSGRLAEIGEREPGQLAIDEPAGAEAGATASPAETRSEAPDSAAPDSAADAAAGFAQQAAGGEQPSAEILLRATQLAISGESREAIAERLRTDYEIDPEPVLRQVLG